MPDLSNYTDNPPDAFEINFFRTLKEEGFGKPPNPFAMRFIRLLKEKGFSVTPTTRNSSPGNAKQTLHIKWNDNVIGLMSNRTWGLKKKPYACLYRYAKDGKLGFVDNVPPDFDKDAFARQHGCDPDQLLVNPDSGKLYLWVQDQETSLRLMQDSARKIDEGSSPRGNREPEYIQNDLLTILEDRSKFDTERLDEVAIRLGQGKFRTDLEREFGNACASTRLAVLSVLRASHIVPWSNSVDEQRLDPMNGLLLSANIDALFDRYMITFRPDGKLEVSKSITQPDLERLGPIQDLQTKPCDRRAAYLRLHNAEFERLEQERWE